MSTAPLDRNVVNHLFMKVWGKTVNIQNRNYIMLTLNIFSDELDITPLQRNRVSENDIPPNSLCFNEYISKKWISYFVWNDKLSVKNLWIHGTVCECRANKALFFYRLSPAHNHYNDIIIAR